MITLEKLQKVYVNSSPNLLKNFVDPINKAIEEYEINNPAMFIAQIGHESAQLKVLVENLNYSADGLLKTFQKYFKTRAEAEKYARKPEMIANRVYANRMGNRDEASGDGWRFRGKGAIQITGYNNHKLFADSEEISIEQAVTYMLSYEGAIMSAAWFWDSVNCNAISDDIKATTRKINNGLNGLAERTELYNLAKKHI
ncbi:COG3179 Predicted chitinase [uncultured Caudovirales phage]|uniref:COG3179 Predicted chitinase n=1 Tax=uncultured Caudovirales phage TaxID=2100421 RepID=A0A6J5NXS7_9CAUD|nr:COG3179 Predicted chitinase [uncultured Caudovirales phage]